MSGKRQHFVNVVGQCEDVICDYRTCRHKLSEHGSSNRKCRCSHPSNKAIGINFSQIKGAVKFYNTRSKNECGVIFDGQEK
jgi:hypothetical protein